jgi:hypothetical protein
MDAIKFIEERNRMCKVHWGCNGCPALHADSSCMFGATSCDSPEKQVEFL